MVIKTCNANQWKYVLTHLTNYGNHISINPFRFSTHKFTIFSFLFLLPDKRREVSTCSWNEAMKMEYWKEEGNVRNWLNEMFLWAPSLLPPPYLSYLVEKTKKCPKTAMYHFRPRTGLFFLQENFNFNYILICEQITKKQTVEYSCFYFWTMATSIERMWQWKYCSLQWA